MIGLGQNKEVTCICTVQVTSLMCFAELWLMLTTKMA